MDNTAELKKMRKKYANLLTMTDGRKKMPYFLGFIAETKDYKNTDRKDYQKYNTSMDILHECLNGMRSTKSKGSNFMPMSDIFKPQDYDKDKIVKKQITKIIDLAKKTSAYNNLIAADTWMTWEEKHIQIIKSKENLLFDINKMKINEHTMYRLLWNLENQRNSAVKNLLFYLLFSYKNNTLIEILKSKERVKRLLTADNDGEITIYGCNFAKKVPPKEF